MNHSSKAFFSIILALLLVFLPGIGAYAHDDLVRIEVSPERLNPGGVLELRGVGFEPEATIQLSLVGAAGVTNLGELSSDAQGEFTQISSIPVDLPEGIYHVRAKSSEHEVISPAITIQGSAVIQDQQDHAVLENDSLLAPIPTPMFDPQSEVKSMSITPEHQPSKVLLIILVVLVMMALAGAIGAVLRRSVNKN